MTQIVAKELLHIRDIETLLEDNLPQFPVRIEVTSPDVAAKFLVEKSTNIGAKISLSVHGFHFSPENLQKLVATGIQASLIAGLRQTADGSPVSAEQLRPYLIQTVGARNAKELLRQHKPAIDSTCGVNSSMVIEEWDPNQFGGLLTGGHSFHIANRSTFVKELFTLLSNKVEHSQAQCTESNCFIATAAAGNSDDQNVLILRRFRDNFLVHNRPGRLAISLYSASGPPIASLISRSRTACKVMYILCVRPTAHVIAMLGRISIKKNRGDV